MAIDTVVSPVAIDSMPPCATGCSARGRIHQ